MARMRYVVTGGTGFIGRRVVSRILSRQAAHDEPAEVWVLVRRESLARFERLASQTDHEWGERAKPLVGDLTEVGLGLTDEARAELGIGPGTLRISIGLEDADDLITDIGEVLERAG